MKKEMSKDEFIKKRIERQKKIRKRRLTAFFIIFIIMLLCAGAVLSFTVFFPIESISIKGSEIYTAEEILEASNITKGDNLFAINRAKTENTIKRKLPFVEKIAFKREVPDTLKITVTDAVEFATFKSNNKYYTVSSSGWVLEVNKKQPKKLTKIICDVKCKVGSEVVFNKTEEKKLLVTISEALNGKDLDINSIDITNLASLKLEVEGRFEVDLGNANNIPEKINHLLGMVQKIDPEKGGKINLSMWSSDNTKGTFIAEQK